MGDIPIINIRQIKKEPDLEGSFSIRKLQEILDGNPMIQKLHRHDFYFCLVLEKASGRHEVDFTPYTVSNHSIFFLRPGQVHLLSLDARTKGFILQFNADSVYINDPTTTQLLRKASQTTLYEPTALESQQLLPLLETIFQEVNYKKEETEEMVRANLRIFFINLIRLQPSSPSLKHSSHTQEQLEKLSRLLETHISTSKQVSQYASMMHLSAYQLNAITKSLVGKTCSQLINEHILLEAKRYLLATSNQINQIAFHLGYEDVSYFIRFFKKHTGHSPEAFRHNFK
ncbi:AraC family transcriptional regulator [Flammeovirgaceae bacterium SG7u.111]|nr:AraC family transcriptional regulator [Flammeovirgaceae bacterium SG7u.132]WPO36658.1 AraC family transcriptional regulator [Flammeovirgaceae bacterium SG7u.111]